MRAQAIGIITNTAVAAGLPENSVYNLARKDNLTIKRPRIEIQFLPEVYRRSGRKLGITRTKTEIIRKRELYVVDMDVAANVLAEDEQWLEAFCYSFAAMLPKGFNDKSRNWVKIRIRKAAFGRPPDIRVGESVIEVFKKASQIFIITFTWRVATEEVEKLIPAFTINPHLKNPGEKHGNTEKE